MNNISDEELNRAQDKADARVYRDKPLVNDPDDELPPLPSPDDIQDNYIGQYQDEYDEHKYDMYYQVGRYDNGRIALDIDCEYTDDDGNTYREPYARVTVNLPDKSIPENLFSDSCGTDEHQEHAFVNNDLTEQFKYWLRQNNIISYPIRTAHQGFVHFELCEILVK